MNSRAGREVRSISGKPLIAGGGSTSVVFFEPLYGGSSEEWVTGLMELQDCFQSKSFLQLDNSRSRHRVSPKTTPVCPPIVFLLFHGSEAVRMLKVSFA